jgi:FKBP-type peptidyl-prolyl cis-trans isomerase (trigger factor)
MRHAAEHAIQHELPEILAKENVLVIESPRVSTGTPIAGQSLTFTARAPLPPKVELPDYKAIAKKQNEIKEDTMVTDEEHAQALTHLKRERSAD